MTSRRKRTRPDKRAMEWPVTVEPILSADGTVLGHAVGQVVSSEEMIRLIKVAAQAIANNGRDAR